MQKLIIIILAVAINCLTNKAFTQNKANEAFAQALAQSVSVPVAATLYINEFPSKKEQFTSDWAKGDIFYTNGSISKNCNLRYNCWKDELIWLRNTDYKTGTVIKDFVADFTLINAAGETKKFTKYYDQSGIFNQTIFLEVLSQGKISLYCYRKVSYNKSNDSFSQKHQYFLKINGQMIKIKLKKSSVYALFSAENQKKLKAILSNNHLKLKKEYELARAFDIFNGD